MGRRWRRWNESVKSVEKSLKRQISDGATVALNAVWPQNAGGLGVPGSRRILQAHASLLVAIVATSSRRSVVMLCVARTAVARTASSAASFTKLGASIPVRTVASLPVTVLRAAFLVRTRSATENGEESSPQHGRAGGLGTQMATSNYESMAKRFWNTAISGSRQTAFFRKRGSCITSTGSRMTTALKTLWEWRVRITGHEHTLTQPLMRLASASLSLS